MVLGELALARAGMARGSLASRLALILAGVVALWLSAKVKVALEPVPVTMQVLVVMSIGMAYGARLGMATVAAYLALGALGAPVFAGTPEKGLGLAYMLGPTGGYLLGFLLAAGVVGGLARRGWDRSPLKTALAMAAGLAVIYAAGVAWLAWGTPVGLVLGGFAGIGLDRALAVGVLPFLWIDALKLALAVLAFPTIWRLVARAG